MTNVAPLSAIDLATFDVKILTARGTGYATFPDFDSMADELMNFDFVRAITINSIPVDITRDGSTVTYTWCGRFLFDVTEMVANFR